MDAMSESYADGRGEPAHARGTDAAGWAAIDEALRKFTAASVIPLLSAAIDAPWTRPWQRHLTLLWFRAVSVPPTGSRSAGNPDLAELVDVAVQVAGHPMQSSGASNDPRQPVGFTIAGRRWRLHPGDNLYPLMTLRRLDATARAVDSTLLRAVGFSLTDVIEVVLAHGDDLVGGLAEAWATASDEAMAGAAGRPVVSTAEVEAVVQSMAAHRDEHRLTDLCSQPERAAMALAWLTCDAALASVNDAPGQPRLGAVLRLRSAGTVFPVPASLTLDALNAAADTLLRRPEIGASDADRLRALTYGHAFAVFSKRAFNRSTPQELELSGPPAVLGLRTMTTVVSALNPDDFDDAIRQATDLLDHRVQTEPHTRYVLGRDLGPPVAAEVMDADNRVKVVVYGGPLVIKLHQVRDVVLLHIEELVELVDAAAGDWATVECFLQDLGEHASHDLVVFQDILDVWTAWRDWGRIGPPAEPDDGRIDEAESVEETVLYVVEAEYDATWVQAAEWEPIDAILAAAGIPEHRDWPVATLDTDGAANLFTTPDGMIALVNIDPALLILIDGTDAAPPHLDADTLFGLADAVRYCITRHDAIAAHFRLADAPVTILLNLTPERPPDPDLGYGVRVRCAPEHALLDIVIGPDVLELLMTDPMTGHDVLGTALHELVDRIRAGRTDLPGTPAAVFREAWREVGPLMTLHTVTDGRPKVAPIDTLPRTPAIRMRALRAVADRIRPRVAPGAYLDASAHAICRDEVLPAIEAVLHDRIAGCDSSLARKVAVRLNAAYATYLRRGHQIAHALTGPWARNWHDAARNDDQPASVSALQVLLEAVLADPPAGTRTADALDLGELAALAEQFVLAATTASGFERDLHGLQVDVNSHGVYVVRSVPADVEDERCGDDRGIDEDSPIDIDLAAYHGAQRDHVITLAAQESWSVQDLVERADREGAQLPYVGQQREPVPFRPLHTFAEPSLVRVDTLLARNWGTGLDGIAAVLGTAVDWPTDDDGIAAVKTEDLVRNAAEWSKLPYAEILAALHLLQIDADELRRYGARRFLDVERRAHRLATRPLPAVDGQILVMPWLINAAQQLHNSYLVAARLPQPALPPSVVNAMTEHRQDRNLELEATVRDIVSAVRLPHRFQFLQGEQHREGIPNPVGEIDLLIADPDTSRLWVCEVKDLATPYSVASMRDHIRKFTHGRSRFIPKLLDKAEHIQRHAEAGARACGVTVERPWRVLPLIVTRHVEPAAYTKDPKLPFTVPSLLADVLRSPLDPDNGPAPAQRPGKAPSRTSANEQQRVT
jgi:hypothetical protein